MAQRKEFTKGKKPVTFVDLFAGAGGISEGFLQSSTDSKYFEFILASDINENCELTHRARYNYQLGLDTKFIKEDIMSEDFMPKLLEAIGRKSVDVITGGPSCQSFSLSGRRRKHDKRDTLFEHYLKVIRVIKPKYFVMENVKGILTKEHGRIKDEIMRQIRSIVDPARADVLYSFASQILGRSHSRFISHAFLCKLKMEINSSDMDIARKELISSLDERFKSMTRGISYKISKSNPDVATVRHGLLMLSRKKERDAIAAGIVQEKAFADIDNDAFASEMNAFIDFMDDDAIIDRMISALERIPSLSGTESSEFMDVLRLYPLSLDEVLARLRSYAVDEGMEKVFDGALEGIRLYRIDKPIVVKSSDYGVPQNRERVLFIGCRNDQRPITCIPATVAPDEKVSVYEAISDLDFIGLGEKKTEYGLVNPVAKYEGLVRKRSVQGRIDDSQKTFSEWSREGRLHDRFTMDRPPAYFSNLMDFEKGCPVEEGELFNHQTSSQNATVQRRLEVIVKHGAYDEACKKELSDLHLASRKRNYTVLNPVGQSPTVMTMPDDFIHYSRYRAMTVREMARLQSFDDDFVFQGKRQTGGEKRKSEIPQYTLVGNAVPPLVARAIGDEILKVIK